MLMYYKLGPYVLELEPRRRVTMNTDGENIDYCLLYTSDAADE